MGGKREKEKNCCIHPLKAGKNGKESLTNCLEEAGIEWIDVGGEFFGGGPLSEYTEKEEGDGVPRGPIRALVGNQCTTTSRELHGTVNGETDGKNRGGERKKQGRSGDSSIRRLMKGISEEKRN